MGMAVRWTWRCWRGWVGTRAVGRGVSAWVCAVPTGFVYPSASRGDERPECTVEWENFASVYHINEVSFTN